MSKLINYNSPSYRCRPRYRDGVNFDNLDYGRDVRLFQNNIL